MDDSVRFCSRCGAERSDTAAEFCSRCGRRFEGASSRGPEASRTPRPLIRPASILLTLILVGGGLWILNSTRIGLSVKCHFLGDQVACFEESLLGATPPTSPASDLTTLGSDAAPCAIQLAEHNASILAGLGGCDTIRSALRTMGTWLDVSMRDAASVGQQVCEGDWNGLHVQVLDTGMAVYGTEACSVLGLP